MRTPWEILSAALTRLEDRVNQQPAVREATLISKDPLLVQFDTDAAPVKAKGGTTQPEGSRVLTVKLRHYIWVISAGDSIGGAPPLPAPWTWASTGGIMNVDGAAATWTDIHADAQITVVTESPLWVMVEASAQIQGATSTYGMIGVQATGALALEPEVGMDGVSGKFGYTAYGEAGASLLYKSLTLHKPLLLPAGSTTLKLRKRRNVTTGTPTLTYPMISVVPMMWAGTPGPMSSEGTAFRMAAGAVLTAASVAAGANISVNIVFPPGRFTQPPVLAAMSANGRCTWAWSAVTTAGATLTGSNWSPGAMPSATQVNWIAVQMTPTSAIG